MPIYNTVGLYRRMEAAKGSRRQRPICLDAAFFRRCRVRKIVAFYPYQNGGTSYIRTMQKMIEEQYEVIPFDEQLDEKCDFLLLRTIYLNWIEDFLNENHIRLLEKAKRYGVRIVWVFHNRAPHDAEKRVLCAQKLKFLIKKSDCIILHSKSSIQYLREYTTKLKESKVVYIEHPNYIGDYGSLSCNRFHKEKEDFVFAIYGNIRPYKNLEILIEAFKRLDAKYNCYLLIAGRCVDKEYLQRLRGMVKDETRISIQSKYILDVEMQAYVDYADILALPYDYTSSMNSGAMILAFSSAKTVIVPDISMSEDFPEELIYQYHYDDEEMHVEQLYTKMMEAYLTGREKNEEKGKVLQALMKEKYSKEMVKQKLIRLL